MDRNMEMFTACDEAFDRGRLIAIYPEGATHAEAHVQRIKTGAARMRSATRRMPRAASPSYR
jgi:1-acyl-sn-glycerol-3-phosphate acyltransferase